MVYYVNAAATAPGMGSEAQPFRTIGEAARLARPGDEVLVAPGIYRECVCPAYGGTEEQPITYRSAVPGGAVITAGERVARWEDVGDGVWRARIGNGLFAGDNPYTDPVRGDWYEVDPAFPVHRGEVFVDGKSCYESPTLDDVRQPKPSPWSWDAEGSLNRWHTCQEGCDTLIYLNLQGRNPNEENVEISVRRRCFWPEREGVNYVTVRGFHLCKAATQWAPPTAFQEGMIGPNWAKGWIIEDCEIEGSKCSGVSLGKRLQPGNDNKWTTRYQKDGTQTERECILQAWREGWSKERVGSHTVRRCNIHDCGQPGIDGHLGGVFSVIEDNHIHHINNKQELTGAEIGGVKMHAAIDVLLRRNHIHHCTRGLWLDWQAQGTRVTGNIFHHNEPPEGICLRGGLAFGEDAFVEISHGPTLLAHNLMLSACSCRLSTQGLALCHNLIAGSFTKVRRGACNTGDNRPDTVRYTPYHAPHSTDVAGFMSLLYGDARFYNNIFVQRACFPEQAAQLVAACGGDPGNFHLTCGTKPYDGFPTPEAFFGKFDAVRAAHGWNDSSYYYSPLPVATGGNVYCNNAQPCDTERDATIVDAPVTLSVESENDGWVLRTNLYAVLPAAAGIGTVSTALLGTAFESEQPFEQPDGAPIVMNTDFFGAHRSAQPLAGPFEQPVAELPLSSVIG